MKTKARCEWVKDGDELYIRYHDTEWAVPVYDDTKLFEFMVLESAQAGLSWRTLLNKREGYRKLFKNFDPKKIARMADADVVRLIQDPSIIRNRAKINSAINNARCFIQVQKEFGSFSEYMWSWVNEKPIQNRWTSISEVSAETDLSKAMAKDLKKRGFSFLGPTVWYAHMQAVGMVNDHTVECFRHKEVKKLRRK